MNQIADERICAELAILELSAREFIVANPYALSRLSVPLELATILRSPEPERALDTVPEPQQTTWKAALRRAGILASTDADNELRSTLRGRLGLFRGSLPPFPTEIPPSSVVLDSSLRVSSHIDLAVDGWVEKLGETQVDAVLSTLALGWLSSEELVRLYQVLGRLVRPGGVFITGDNNMHFGPQLPSFRRLYESAKASILAGFAPGERDTWVEWWDAVAREPSLAQLVAERERLFATRPKTESPTYDLHVAALYDAGFREVGTLWQSLSNRGLLAVR